MLRQNINQALDSRVEVLNTTGLVPSPFTGATSTTVLLFVGAPTFVGPQGAVTIPSWLTAVNDANLGTVVTILKPGVYQVDLYIEEVADAMVGFDVVYGISQDVAVGGLTAVPAFATAGMLAVQRNVSVVNEAIVPLPISTTVMVSPEQSIAGSAIRFHAALAGGGPPVDALNPAADDPSAWYRIRRIDQLHA
jgi:hypothetical protein